MSSNNNFWDQFQDAGAQPASAVGGDDSFWNQFRDASATPSQPNTQKAAPIDENSLGRRTARTVKSAAAGIIGGVPDTAALAYNLPALGLNALGVEAPMIPSATEAIDKGIDTLTGGYTNTPESARAFQEGIKTGGAVLGGGLLATAAKKAGRYGAQKVLEYVGSTKPTAVLGGGAAGYASTKAQEAGYGAPASIGIGLAAGSVPGVVSSVTGGLKNVPKALIRKSPLSEKNLNLDYIRAAKEAGLGMSATAASKSDALSNAEQVILRLPYLGTKQETNLRGLNEDYSNMVRDSLEKVGKRIANEEDPALALYRTGDVLKDTLEDTSKKIVSIDKEKYINSINSAPENAGIYPKHMLDAIKKAQKEAKRSYRLSPDNKFVVEYTDDLLKNLDLDKNGGVANIGRLVDQKQSLNKEIKWTPEAQADDRLLKMVRAGVLEDLKEYGKLNKPWWETFSDAEKYHGKYVATSLGSKPVRKILSQQDPAKILPSITSVEEFRKIRQALGHSPESREFFNSLKREKLESILLGQTIDKVDGTVKYLPFTKMMENQKNIGLVKEIIGQEGYKKLKLLEEYAQGMVLRARGNKNTSGSGNTNTAFAIVGSLVAGKLGVGTLAKGALLGAPMTAMVMNKKLLNYAINIAEADIKKRAGGVTKWTDKFNKELIKEIGEAKFRELVNLTAQNIRE